MEIILSPKIGFCFGVKRAIELCEKTIAKYNSNVYTIGEIIHNSVEMNRLYMKGLKYVFSEDEIQQGTVVCRAHGLPRHIFDELRKKGINVIDATCPFVKKVQQLVRKLSLEKFNIIIVGDAGHPEVKALASFAEGSKVFIVANEEDINKLILSESFQAERCCNLTNRVAVLSQTTQTIDKFTQLVHLLKQNIPIIEVFDTICYSSTERQLQAAEIAKKVSLMLVIGGKNSANTIRLVDICRNFTSTKHIETAEELRKEWFNNVSSTGIATGTSTPEWLVEKIILWMKRLNLTK